jgi:hypothetical protein
MYYLSEVESGPIPTLATTRQEVAVVLHVVKNWPAFSFISHNVTPTLVFVRLRRLLGAVIVIMVGQTCLHINERFSSCHFSVLRLSLLHPMLVCLLQKPTTFVVMIVVSFLEVGRSDHPDDDGVYEADKGSRYRVMRDGGSSKSLASYL